MKFIDKLKNVFFEEVEEDEEVEETPKTYAKKVEVPKKKINIFKSNDDDEKEEVKVKKKDLDNFLEEEEVKVEVTQKEVKEEKEFNKNIPMMFDDDDFLLDEKEKTPTHNNFDDDAYYFSEPKKETKEYEKKELYQGKKETPYIDNINNPPAYSYSKSSYSKADNKGFKPSPIISPIYGILDKNYHKEEVVTKRETRITSTYKKPDLDSVRNKAFASVDEEKENVTKPQKSERKYRSFEEPKMYDVNNDKPQVSKVTLADADEYYNDLGLAYNVDYSDASRTPSRSAKYNTKEKKKEKKDVDDNLFDLIDSMYNKED